jgi:hypothetical protein
MAFHTMPFSKIEAQIRFVPIGRRQWRLDELCLYGRLDDNCFSTFHPVTKCTSLMGVSA